MRRALWLPVAFLCASAVEAQVVTGRVLDAGTGAGVRTAFVEVFDATGERVGAALTQSDGRYRVLLPTDGTLFRVDVNSLSHQGTQIDSVSVGAEEVVVLADVVLNAVPLILEGIVVQGRQRRVTLGQEAIRRHQLIGNGTFLPGAMIAAADPSSLTQHLATASGLRVERRGPGPGNLNNPSSRTGDECVIVMVNRWPLNRPGIDGGPPLGFRDLDDIPLEWIAGVEVFNDYHDVPDLYWTDAIIDALGAPTEYCGYVNIWLWNSWS